MEDTEFEEGEACSYQYDEQTNIDLDALTYIDEKLQNVLGHLKKDFEGGVTSEDLGTKYGGYGSFLTQPIPLSSNSRSLVNFQDNHSHKSATCLSFEGGNYSSLSRSNGNHFMKHESGSVRSASSELYKAPSVHDSVRQIVQDPLKHSTAKLEVVDKSNNMNEHKTLKVRIKVSSDNLSAKNNTAIYNGLGLVSPSSSFDDSPIVNEGLSEGLQFPGDESPTQIIRIMTSFPIYGGQPLSPLPEGLARLTAKLLQGNKVEPAFRHSRDNSVMRSNRKSAKILSVEDSLKSGERDHFSPKHKGRDGKTLYDVDVIVNDQADLNTEACVVLVSEALKLPLLSDLHGPSEGKRDTSKQKSNLLPNAVKGEPLVPILNSDGNCDEKQIGEESVAVEVADEEKVDLLTDVPSYPKKDGDGRGEAANSSTIANGNDLVSKSRKASISGLCSFEKEKSVKKSATTVEQDGKNLPSGREQLPSGDKKKHKGNQFIGPAATEIQKDSIGHAVSGNRDSSTPSGIFAKQKDKTKARDKYKDFFGEMNENRDDLMDYLDEPSNGRFKTSQINEQGLLSCDNNVREISDNGAHDQLMLKVDSKRAFHFAPPSDRLPPSGDPTSAAAPVEDWVQCDMCLKWRLIPFGTKVDSLPEKWLCSMLDWLPGMNSCNITEEETTKAVTLLYQSQIQVGLHGSLEAVVPGVTAPTNLHRTQTQRDIFRGGEKKHNGLKEVPNSKLEFPHSVKDTSLSNGVGSDLENGMHLQHFRNPIDPVLQANQPKKKSKKKKLDSYSDGGHSNYTKIGGQREPNQDYARAKKMKTEDDGWMSTHGPLTNHASSARSFKGHIIDSLQNSIDRSPFQAQAFPHAGCLDTRDFSDSNLDTKKRKVKNSIDVSPSILSVTMVNDSEQMGQKKARVSLPEEKVSRSSQGKGRTDKRRKGLKDHRLGKDVGSILILDDRGSLKQESGSGATSSCSKILESQKSKSILQKVKSSPVRSLSSSPFRTTNVDTLGLGRKKLPDDSGDVPSGAMKKILSGKNRIDGFLVDDKVQNKQSLGLPSHISAASQTYTLDKHSLCTSEASVEDGSLNQPVKSVCNDNGFLPRQSAKVVASVSKDKDRMRKPESDKSKVKICESYDDSRDHPHSVKDKTRCIISKFQENSGCIGDEMDIGGKKSASGILLDEASKENGKLKSVGQVDPVIKEDSTCIHETGSVAKKKIKTDYGEKVSKSIDQDKDEEMGLHSGKEKSGNKGDGSNHAALPYQGSVADATCADVHDSGKGLKEQSSTKKSDTQNGTHFSTSKHPLSNVRKLKDRDTPSPMRRDSHNQAAINALKEAKDLKHLADRKKNSGSPMSTGLYFEATLTFLHAACLFESSGSENSKRGDIIQSMQVYSSTAKLCEFCAHEYEKSKDLASAALAYKCMEVAYLRVIYSSHPAASRDRHELQSSLQMIPPGESPSSSASDIDNASTAAEKAAQVRDGNSPQTAGNFVIAARSRPIFLRFLNFMQDVNFAMEASRKSQGAFAAAKVAMQQNDSKEGIASIKRALDFNFHDVNGLLRLVRLAMEAIKL